MKTKIKKAYSITIKGTHDCLIVEPLGSVKLSYDPNTEERRTNRLIAISKNQSN